MMESVIAWKMGKLIKIEIFQKILSQLLIWWVSRQFQGTLASNQANPNFQLELSFSAD